MSTLVSQMTKEELIELIESVFDRKLMELLDDGEIKPKVIERLKQQGELVAQGERGQAFDDIIQQLDLD